MTNTDASPSFKKVLGTTAKVILSIVLILVGLTVVGGFIDGVIEGYDRGMAASQR